jgi:voltage-gated potassium channel
MSLTFNSLQALLQSKERFLILMGLIMALLVVGPILEPFVAIRILIDVFLTAIVLSMLYIATHKNRLVQIGRLLAIVMLISLWLKYFFNYEVFAATSMMIGVLFTVVVTAHTLAFIIKSETVTGEVIYAAMLVYLLVAQLWALVYTFLDLIDPASFNLPQGQSDFLLFEYYSFVTLTTLGYGDITPLTRVAKAFSVLEAVVGQLYLVVVVAWFVGMHVSRKSNE